MELFDACTQQRHGGGWASSLVSRRVCITGGCGFVGTRLADAFALCGVSEIVLFDLRPVQAFANKVPVDEQKLARPGDSRASIAGIGDMELHPSRCLLSEKHCDRRDASGAILDATWTPATGSPPVRFRTVTGDISDRADVAVAVGGCDVVVHLAAYGMSGKSMLDKVNIERINVRGTANVILCCKQAGVRALLYASSYNAVFYGQKLVAAGADVERPPPTVFSDHYSRTKSIAEGLVIAANDSRAPTENALATVALRLSGIYGPGEQRHFPRTIGLVKAGMVLFTVGGTTNLVDWVYIDNIAYCFARTAAGVLQGGERRRKISGRCFPVSDHHPINQWLMMRPLIEAMGVKFPTIDLPMWPMYYLAALMDMLLLLVSPVIALDPFLTKGEMLKVGIEHYFAPSASRDIEYAPIVAYEEGMRRTVCYFVHWAAATFPDAAAAALSRKKRIATVALGTIAVVLFLLWLTNAEDSKTA